MINYTKEQQEAIDYFEGNLLISASAGSGKTQVLLEKVLKLLCNGVNLNEILMVTFTNLAASEMKSKLENMVMKKIEEGSYDYLFDSLNKINTSDILTLHSFCQKLVKEYYYILNIEPNFEIKDEAFLSYLKTKAINDTIKFYLDLEDSDFIKVSNLFVHKRDYSVFKEEILKFYEFLTSKLNKFEFCDKFINSNYNINLNQNELFTLFKDFVYKKNNVLKNEVLNIKNLAKKIHSEKLIELSNIFYNNLDYEFKDNESFIKFYLKKIDFPQIRLKNNCEIGEIELKEKLQELSKKIKKHFSLINEILNVENIDFLKQDILESKQVLNKFVEITKKYEENYNKLKLLNNCLDFNDLENLTLKLFTNNDILDEISSKYKYIFVDEYQDTNLVQEEILKLLSKKSKRIMVGDIKQSIYAFRQCNPKIFSDKIESYAKSKVNKVINLNKNFRSNKNILDFSNTIFSNLMLKENSDYNYKKDGMFVCGNVTNNNLIDNIEVLCINKKSDDQVENMENLLVLNTINNLLKQKIIEDGVERSLTYRDIAIISRKRNDNIKNLCSMFDEYKIPYSVKYSAQIYKSFEVNLILSYLNLLNNLNNDIYLYSILKNVYNFKTNDIIAIKNKTLKDSITNFDGNKEIKVKIDKFFEDYNYFKNLVGEKTVKNLIEEIIEKLNLSILFNKNFGKISNEKIKVFIDNIPSSLYSLNEFILYCDNLKDKKFEIKKVTKENCITIDTFHSTKGLEYNAVIINNAGDKIFSKNSSNLIYNAKFGIGIYKFEENNKIKTPNVIYSMINILNKQEEFNEEVRLSYVAFTRAKNYLSIIGKENPENLKPENNYINFLDFNSYLSLIFSADVSKNATITFFNGNEDIFMPNVKQNENIIENLNLDFNVYENLINKTYRYNDSLKLQLKNSVTSLSNEDKEIYNISNFMVTDLDKEDYIEIGNSYHLALEKLPFNLKTEQEVRNIIVNLIENKVLPENIYEFIDEKKILLANKEITKLIDINDKIFKEQVFMVYMPYNHIKNSSLEDKILVQGIIDLYIEKENEIVLIDYKTSRLNDINLIKKYDLQLTLYEKALKEKYKNKKITKYIYSIFLDKLINVV